MAIQTVKRRGNSRAVRMPANCAYEAGFAEGREVEVDGQNFKFSGERVTADEMEAAKFALKVILDL